MKLGGSKNIINEKSHNAAQIITEMIDNQTQTDVPRFALNLHLHTIDGKIAIFRSNSISGLNMKNLLVAVQ